MNANASAQCRKWKIVVIAAATVGNGPIWISSQLATLEVAPPFVGFAMERAATEQGKSTDLFCKVQVATPFEGKATVQLVGLPNQVSAPPVEITKETKEFAFKVAAGLESPPGQHKTLFCQLVITQQGEPIMHNLGGSELRIDVPIAQKAAAPVQTAGAKPAAPPPQVAPAKRLSRLEKLRLEQEEREKAAKAGAEKK
jgi:hypothetical protein